MNRGLWIARKNYLCTLIKKVSDAHGGDEIEWLRDYCREVLEDHPGDKIEKAILCFLDLADQVKYVPCRTRIKYEQA